MHYALFSRPTKPWVRPPPYAAPLILSGVPSDVGAIDGSVAIALYGTRLDTLDGATVTAYSGIYSVPLVQGVEWSIVSASQITLLAGASSVIPDLVAAGAATPFSFFVRFVKGFDTVDSPTISVSDYAPSLDFSDPRNSMYIPLLFQR